MPLVPVSRPCNGAGQASAHGIVGGRPLLRVVF